MGQTLKKGGSAALFYGRNLFMQYQIDWPPKACVVDTLAVT